ncbi:respiratory nitrate reductase subunit gamma [Streptomyces sp. NPDC057702]|uniref:respiratory nitrate reductase subunit gamma n=1 Tax=unclassified Streptomyces TaxID=2593676 RepID=UPI0036C6F891
MDHLHTTLWGVLPYLTLTCLVAGTAWRYRYDRFGFTTRSSQLHENRLLRVGSPLFHFGLLLILMGHIVGLLVPESFTEWLHVTEAQYSAGALVAGSVAGLMATGGLAILVWRRTRVKAVRRASSRSDRVLYPVLGATLVAGLMNTMVTPATSDYDYRLGVSVWVRSLFTLDPDVSHMADAPLQFQVHAVLAMALFALWPFSRLVHAFTAPVGYLFRPYVVYRARNRRVHGPYGPRDGYRSRGDHGPRGERPVPLEGATTGRPTPHR